MPAILTQIIDNVEETLSNVSQLSGSAEKLIVRRLHQLAVSPEEGLCVISLGDPERDYESTPETHLGWAQPVHVAVYTLPAEADQTPIDDRLIEYMAAVETAMLIDVTRGQLAWDTIPAYSVIHYSPSGVAIVQSTFHVMYRYVYGNPYAQ